MDSQPEINHSAPRSWTKPLVLVVVMTAAAIGYFAFRESLTLHELAAKESELRDLQRDRPLLVYGGAILIYVVVTGLSLPGALVLTIVYGWLFGIWKGVLIVSFASTTGATIAFLVSRFLLRDYVQRHFGPKLVTFNEALKRDGAFYLFVLRLIPAVPFFVINLVTGLTPMSTSTFWWVSQLGMLPGTSVYVYTGASVPNLETLERIGIKGVLTPQLLIAFALLGLMPIALKKVVERFRPTVDA